MDFASIYTPDRFGLSLEFFPPKSEDKLPNTISKITELAELKPDFMTVTYGAGGGTRSLTKQLVSFIHRELSVPAVAHLTCVGHEQSEIEDVLKELEAAGIRHVLALRGDPPKGEDSFQAHPSGFTCARDLAKFISSNFEFEIAVAGYPEVHQDAKSADDDIAYLKEKVDAGAGIVITQLFFEPDLYFRFVDRARRAGIEVPIVPGVMPIANVNQVQRFTSMCGASIPPSLRDSLVKIEGNAKKVREFGTNYAIEMSRSLLEGGAPGIHLYTLNKCVQAKPIVQALSSYFDSSEEVANL